MFTFMLGVLGSFMFWVVYFVISFFVSVFLIRRNAKRTYYYIMNGKVEFYHNNDSPVEYFFMVALHLIGWPLIVFWYIFKFFIWAILKTVTFAFCLAARKTAKMIPEIEIKFNK